MRYPSPHLLSALLALLTLTLMGLMTASGSQTRSAGVAPDAAGGGAGRLAPTSKPAVARTPIAIATPVPCGWNLVDSPNPDPNSNSLYGVAVIAPNDVWAVGHYDSRPLAQHWDGTRWELIPVPSPSRGGFSAVAAIASNDVWAVGYYSDNYNTLVEHWDGNQWSIVPSPNRGSESHLQAIAAIASDDVWAVGYYYPNAFSKTLIEHWDGSQWSIVPSPNVNTNGHVLRGVAAVSANDVWAVGLYADSTTSLARTLTEHWDGSQWSIVPSPNPPGASTASLSGVAAVASNGVWAVGQSGHSMGTHRTLIEHWDGDQWHIVPSPNAGASVNWLFGVSARSMDDAWAVGYYCCPNVQGSLVLHWDGGSWSLESHPDPGTVMNILTGVAAVSSSDVWGVGYYWNGSGTPYLTLVEHYAGACGNITPTPTATSVIEATHTATATGTPTLVANTPTRAASATGTPAVTPTATSCTITFSDVHPGDYFYAAVNYLYCHGVIYGYGDNTFRPYNNTTRGQMSKIVTLGFGLPIWTPEPSATPTFRDVPRTDAFFDFIETAAHNRIVSGYHDGTFRPYNSLTRGQVSKIVVLAAAMVNHWAIITPPAPTFNDVPVGSPFYAYVETAYCHGLISGYSNGSFRPGNDTTRGQISKVQYLAILDSGLCQATPVVP